METSNISGKAIRNLRKRHGLTQDEIGVQMGYVGNSPHAFISYVESGKNEFKQEREPELVAAFNRAYRLKYGEDLNLKEID